MSLAGFALHLAQVTGVADREIVFGWTLTDMAKATTVIAALCGAIFFVVRWMVLWLLDSKAAKEKILIAAGSPDGLTALANGLQLQVPRQAIISTLDQDDARESLTRYMRQATAHQAIADAFATTPVINALTAALTSANVLPHITGTLARPDAQAHIAAAINSETGRPAVAAALKSNDAEAVIVSYINGDDGRREVAFALNSDDALAAMGTALGKAPIQEMLLRFLEAEPAKKKIVAGVEWAGFQNAERTANATLALLQSPDGRETVLSVLKRDEVALELLNLIMFQLFIRPEYQNRLWKLLESELVKTARPDQVADAALAAARQAEKESDDRKSD